MTLSRRSLITGLVSLVASPAIVRAGSLMPVKAWTEDIPLALCRDEFGLIPGSQYRAEFSRAFEALRDHLRITPPEIDWDAAAKAYLRAAQS